MPATIPFTDLRARLAETLRALKQASEPLFISRRGEPAAVLMSVAQHRLLTGQAQGHWRGWPLGGRGMRRRGMAKWRTTHTSGPKCATGRPAGA
jgi:prevent-host-death family protein